MISKNRIKDIHFLGQKKKRDEENLFVAEGPKVIEEFLPVFHCTYIATTEEWKHADNSELKHQIEIDQVTEDELRKISFLQHPQEVLAVFQKPKLSIPTLEIMRNQLCLALDSIQDPGNLGTIIRLADWFGISHLFCSLQTADAFGPKVVQASMGALARVSVHYVDLPDYLSGLSDEIPVYGTFLEGRNIYEENLSQNGVIVMGNEGNGICQQVDKFVTKRLYIPNYPQGCKTSESLNVAVATAITCAEFRRQAQIVHL